MGESMLNVGRTIAVFLTCLFVFTSLSAAQVPDAPPSAGPGAPAAAPRTAPPADVAAPSPSPAANTPVVAPSGNAPFAGNTSVALNDETIYRESLAALTMLLVLAVLLENAFALIFNWRVFLAYFSLRGVKTIVMFAVSLAVVLTFNLDIVASLINAYKPAGSESQAGFVSALITALILAGGSAGIHNIMYALGYRSDRGAEEIDATPPKDKAWLAVRVVPMRKQAISEAFVKVRKIGDAAAVTGAPAPIAGTIGFSRPQLKNLLMRGSDRYPQNGGHVLLPDVVYEISVEAKDNRGVVVPAPAAEQIVLAPGAVVDRTVRL